ncbi:MAG TPA: cell division protein SepF [Firmicutes bacterium]|nr:cell division protein SepF [Bacillota bacterium]
MKNWENSENWEATEGKKGILERIMHLFGIETEEVVEEVYPENHGTAANKKNQTSGKVVSLPNPSKAVKLVVFEPQGFDDVQPIVDHLKNRRPVILNMEEIEKSLARRITDFVGGAVYALDGAVQKVSTSIILFTPANIEVSIPPRSELNGDFFTTK